MEFLSLQPQDRADFRRLAVEYYRDGEDAGTPLETITAFIDSLFDLAMAGTIGGCLAVEEEKAVGFALFALDTEDFPFSQMPGLGTILEIGLTPASRGTGQGKALVRFIEDRLRELGAEKCYVSAYGPAEGFWTRCGYEKTEQTAQNGLPIFVKSIGQQKPPPVDRQGAVCTRSCLPYK